MKSKLISKEYWRKRKEKFLEIFQSEAFRDGFPFFIGTIGIILYLQATGMIYEGIAGHSLWVGRPLTLFKVVYLEVAKAKIVEVGLYRVLIISSLMPFCYLYLLFMSYKFKKWKGVEVTAILSGVLIAWLMLADTLLNFALSRSFTIGDPFNIFRYWLFEQNISHNKDIMMAFFMSGVPVLIFIFWYIGKDRNKGIYGNAHFATYAEVARAGLFKKEGVYLGKAFQRELFIDGYEHLILFAPTGSFKTTSAAIPNLFRWKGSCVCTDIKYTSFELTSLFRQRMGQMVYFWNPACEDGFTHCYNPLDYISNDPLKCIDDIQRIAHILIPENPNVKDPFWDNQARKLLTALIHYVMGSKKHIKTLGEINRLLKSYSSLDTWITSVLENENVHYICSNNLNSFLDTPEVTRQSIKETLLSRLSIFDNPFVEGATSRSDFNLRDIRKIQMTIYIGVPDGSLDRLAPLISIFYEQLIHETTASIPDIKEEPHGVLLLIDEFGRLNRMPSFKRITTLRDYRIRIFMILQEVAQLYSIYGKDDAKLFLNSKIRMSYTPNDLDTSKYLESCLGTKTIKIKNESRKLNMGILDNAGISESTQTISRPLMLAQEIREMSTNKSLIMLEGGTTIYADKIPWFKDNHSSTQIKGKIEVPDISELIRGLFDRATRIAKALKEIKIQQKKLKEQKAKKLSDDDKKKVESSSEANANQNISLRIENGQESTNQKSRAPEDSNEVDDFIVKKIEAEKEVS